MAQLIVRNLEDTIRDRLRDQATRHGLSMEEEIRNILRAAVVSGGQPCSSTGLGTRISQRFANMGLEDGFELPQWTGEKAKPVSFD